MDRWSWYFLIYFVGYSFVLGEQGRAKLTVMGKGKKQRKERGKRDKKLIKKAQVEDKKGGEKNKLKKGKK